MQNKQLTQLFTTLQKTSRLLQIKGNNESLVESIEDVLNHMNSDSYNDKLENSTSNETILSLLNDIKSGKPNTFYNSLTEEYPESLLELLDIPNVTPRVVKILKNKLNINSFFELAGFYACSPDKLADMPVSLTALESMHKYVQNKESAVPETFLNMEGRLFGALITRFLTEHLGNEWQIHLTGEVRRCVSLIKNLEIILSKPQIKFPLDNEFMKKLAEDIIDYTCNYKSVQWQMLSFQDARRPPLEKNKLSYTTDENSIDLILPSGIPLKIYFCEYENIPKELIKRTSSHDHWDKLKHSAQKSIFPISSNETKKIEQEFYSNLKMSYIPPEIREGGIETELAIKKELPELIQVKNIKGDLHAHTNWSDGKVSIQEMAEAAQKLGYEYIAITDHTRAVQIVPGLDKDSIMKQIKEIRELNKKFNGTFTILAGSEVDIMPDGSLYFPDEILKELDIVIASLHLDTTSAPHLIYKRILKALENPYIDIMAHPTGRILHVRDYYKIDWEEILGIVLQKGKAMEINSNPSRLDMTSKHVKMAVKMGIPISIDTDSHNPNALKLMDLGVSHARKGWATAGNILNTLSLHDLKEWIKNRRIKNGIG